MILLPWCGESGALCLFPESFSAASSSQVHFNIAPQWKTIKDRIREAYYSANNKKRNIFLLFTKVSLSRKKKSTTNSWTFQCVSRVSLFCAFVFLAASFWLLSSRCGFSDHKVMLTVAFFFLLSYIFYEQPQPHVSLFYGWSVGSFNYANRFAKL